MDNPIFLLFLAHPLGVTLQFAAVILGGLALFALANPFTILALFRILRSRKDS
jgi:hypothetical protein